MGSIDSELREAFESERDAVTTPGAVLGSVTSRVRRRRAATLVGASAGTLGVVGLGVAIPLAFSHGAAATVAPGATPAATVTPPDVMFANALRLGCGDPVPPLLLSSADRTQIEIEQPVVTSYVASGSTILTSPVQSDTPVSVTRLYATYDAKFAGLIVARDGVVIGWTDATPPLEGQVSIGIDDRPADPRSVSIAMGVIAWCPAGGGDAQADANPMSGTYVAYPIVDPNHR